jgi:hypothetical protein
VRARNIRRYWGHRNAGNPVRPLGSCGSALGRHPVRADESPSQRLVGYAHQPVRRGSPGRDGLDSGRRTPDDRAAIELPTSVTDSISRSSRKAAAACANPSTSSGSAACRYVRIQADRGRRVWNSLRRRSAVGRR